MELTAQKGKGNREKRTSDRARTWDLRSIAEFQPREPRRLVEILRPPSLLCTGHRCAAIQRHLRPAPQGWYCDLQFLLKAELQKADYCLCINYGLMYSRSTQTLTVGIPIRVSKQPNPWITDLTGYLHTSTSEY